MKKILKVSVLAAMLLGLPLVGVLVAEAPLSRYFEFPPRTFYIEHAPFSWIVFIAYCLAKWVYHIPLVQRFHVFEMPILGYAGYLSFGLECTVVAEMVLKINGRSLNPVTSDE